MLQNKGFFCWFFFKEKVKEHPPRKDPKKPQLTHKAT